jgi:DNA repair protein RadC
MTKPVPHYHGHRQRLKSKFLKKGADALSDHEMLELVLFLAVPRIDVKPLVKELMQAFGSYAAVLRASDADLKKIKGIGDSTVLAFKSVQAAALALAEQTVQEMPSIRSWKGAVDFLRAKIGFSTIEHFYLIFLNNNNKVIKCEEHQRGTINTTPVYPREVVRRTLEVGAAAVIMVHNHPSGDASPSVEDMEITREIDRALKTVGIQLHDHIVISQNGVSSLRSMGLI